MTHSQRKCIFKEHDEIQPTFVCIYEQCNQDTRWACSKCIIQGLHQHGQKNKCHLLNSLEFLIFIKQQQQSLDETQHRQQLFIQQQLMKLNNILKSCKILIQQLEQFSINIQQNKIFNLNQLISQAKICFQSIGEQQTDKLIKMNKNSIVQFNKENQVWQLSNIIIQCQDLKQQVKQDSINLDLSKKQSYHQKFNYQDYFYQKEQYQVCTLEISPNEQFIAFGGYNTQLIVINLITKSIVKELKCDYIVWKCKFSYDSNYIFCAHWDGYLDCYDIKQDFKRIYKNKVHDKIIYDIKLIDNNQVITCSYDLSIIITDITNKIQLLKINDAHLKDISSIEYDSVIQVIISGSYDKSVKLFLMNGNLLIDQQNAHDDYILQILLTNNNNNLVSRSNKSLKQWKIDYQSRSLKLIRQFLEDGLINLQYSLNDTIMIKIYTSYLLIVDQKFDIIMKRQHNLKDLRAFRYSNQTSSMNYLLILSQNEIVVLKDDLQ